MSRSKFYITLFIGLFFLHFETQAQINLDFRFKTGLSMNFTRFDAQHDKIPQLVGHYNTVKYIMEQSVGQSVDFEDYVSILAPKKTINEPTVFVEANLELQQWPLNGIIGCGNSQFDFNSFAWWYGLGFSPKLALGYSDSDFIIFSVEARRHTDSGFDEDAIINSFGADEKFKKDMRSFFTAPNSLGSQKAWLGCVSLNYQHRLAGKNSLMGGPFLAIDFTKDVDRPAGVNMTCWGIKAAFCFDLGSRSAGNWSSYFSPFSLK